MLVHEMQEVHRVPITSFCVWFILRHPRRAFRGNAEGAEQTLDSSKTGQAHPGTCKGAANVHNTGREKTE